MFGFMGTMSGGWIADLVGRKTDIRAGRTVVGLCSLIGACLLMSAGIWSSEGRVAALLMALAAAPSIFIWELRGRPPPTLEAFMAAVFRA